MGSSFSSKLKASHQFNHLHTFARFQNNHNAFQECASGYLRLTGACCSRRWRRVRPGRLQLGQGQRLLQDRVQDLPLLRDQDILQDRGEEVSNDRARKFDIPRSVMVKCSQPHRRPTQPRSRTSRTRRSARPSGREITGTTMETRSGRWVFPETLLAFMSLPSRSFLAYPGIGKYGTENTFDTQLRAMNIQ